MVLTFIGMHLLAAVLAGPLVRTLGRWGFAVLALVPAATAAWMLTALSGPVRVERTGWVAELGLELSFRLDPLAVVMSLVVAAVGALVLLYCCAYIDPRSTDGDPRLLGAALVGFAGAMLGLVTTDDLLLLYVFWEITTVLSYLLVGYLTTSAVSTRAARQALIVTAAGGLTMLVGLVLLGESAGTYRISELLAGPRPATAAVAWGVGLLLVGAVTKSALVPFHFWLPGAMAAPTPVSAYLHAAAMVKAGVYLVARFAPGYADLPVWQVTVLLLGSATMLLGGFRATRQTDLKLLLAYGTVSQLGMLVLLVGYGNEAAALAGLTLVVSHALFKSSLFLATGAIDHATGTRDIRVLHGVARAAPWLTVAGVLAALSMAGLPALIGFVGKEAALGALLEPPNGWVSLQGVAAVSFVAGSVLTVAYSARFVVGAFGPGTGSGSEDAGHGWHAPGPLLVGIPLVLALGGLVMGVTSLSLEEVLAGHTSTVTLLPGPEVHLGLWHGLSLPLLVSVCVWGLGALWWWRTRDPAGPVSPLVRVDAGRAYDALMRGVDRTALESTGFLSRGSLPALLGTILLVVLVLPGLQLVLGGTTWPSSAQLRVADGAAQVSVALIVVAAAILATRARRRLRAVFLVGVTGYGCAMLFLLHGAPDLALTQLLVETVSLVVLVLVLRRLSGRFPDDPSVLTRRLRAALGAGVGLVVGLLAVVATSSRIHEPAGAGLPERSVDYGAGKNIVNVILVDIRAWDTMGELSVVLACATGVASLVWLREEALEGVRKGLQSARGARAGWRSPPTPTDTGSLPTSQWIAMGDRLDPQRRSVILEIVTRLVFHTILLWSVYLLLAGHNQPGGGFAAGIVAGLALCLRFLAGRGYELRAALPVMPAAVLGTGLFIAAGSAVIPMLLGSPALRTWDAYLTIPLVGEVHLVTSLLFDLGVYLVVIGLMLDVLRSLGSGLDAQIATERETAGRGTR
ncbi:Na(+) H(+) antiporter subunit A [Serinicoccus hydrothermalis]|uniref:Na(+) H(+) antiporter subunit A n=1 Tax=Serinicoccus hydrothermalis TaxID=1758689 RepID=A0A1B1ND29_9MICO|nr:Na+/H+ antiporter subunit A [Serinicoccus hydrothermalis]ANS79314.1 Na(+) H(+) antiporter subunit A [Serinicoccus hydrothermalis]